MSEHAALLPERRGHVSTPIKALAERFLDKWRVVRMVIHILLSFADLVVAIFILVEVRRFYNIVHSLANQSGYKGDFQVYFLNECEALACGLIGIFAVQYFFGILDLIFDSKLIEKHRILWPKVELVIVFGVMIAEVGIGSLLWEKGADMQTSMEVATLTRGYASLPTELTHVGSVTITAAPDGGTLDAVTLRSTVLLNALQIMMKCCGSESGYEDFRDSPYFFDTFPLFPPPVFCCRFEDNVLKTLKYRSCYSMEARRSENMSNARKGCIPAIEEYRRRYFLVIYGPIFGVVVLKFIALLFEWLIYCLRSDAPWIEARTKCTASIVLLQTELIRECGLAVVKDHQESYLDSMSSLRQSCEKIGIRLDTIKDCLWKKLPDRLSHEYSIVSGDVVGLVEECRRFVSRMYHTYPSFTDDAFDFPSFERLVHAVFNMREGCEAIITNTGPDDREKKKLRKQLLRGAFCSYDQCHKATKEAVTLAGSKLFTDCATQIKTAAGTLLNDLKSSSTDEIMLRAMAKQLSVAGYTIAKSFTAGNLLTLGTRSAELRQVDETKKGIDNRCTTLVRSIISFLEVASELTQADTLGSHFRECRIALGDGSRKDIAKQITDLYKYAEVSVPGLMDITSIMDDIESLRQNNWEMLEELANYKRPLADFYAYFFGDIVAEMKAALENLAQLASQLMSPNETSQRRPDIMYNIGQTIIRLDSSRCLLQLEACGLIATASDLGERRKMMSLLMPVLEKCFGMFYYCQAYITTDSSLNENHIKSWFELSVIQLFALKIAEDVDTLAQMHKQNMRNREYTFCREGSTVLIGERVHTPEFDKLTERLPGKTNPQRAIQRNDAEPYSGRSLTHTVALTEVPEDFRDAVDRDRFPAMRTEIENSLRAIRIISELPEVKSTKEAHTPKLYSVPSVSHLVQEVSLFRNHVEQLITKVANGTETVLAYFNIDAFMRLCETCEAAAVSSNRIEVRKEISNACLNVGKLYSRLLDQELITETSERTGQQPQSRMVLAEDALSHKLQVLRSAIDASLHQIESAAQRLDHV